MANDDEKIETRVNPGEINLVTYQADVNRGFHAANAQTPISPGTIQFVPDGAEQFLNMDINVNEEARCLHRVVRAMHDGHCPSCGYLGSSDTFYHRTAVPSYHCCPACGFTVTQAEATAALSQFQSIMHRNCDVFLAWRKRRNQTPVPQAPAVETFVPATRDTCMYALREDGEAAPRTCQCCQLGPCRLKAE